MDLTAAKNVIETLRKEQDDTRARLRDMEEMFDVIASGNLETMRAWESVRQSVHRDHTPEEQVEMDRRVDDHSSDLCHEIK